MAILLIFIIYLASGGFRKFNPMRPEESHMTPTMKQSITYIFESSEVAKAAQNNPISIGKEFWNLCQCFFLSVDFF